MSTVAMAERSDAPAHPRAKMAGAWFGDSALIDRDTNRDWLALIVASGLFRLRLV